MCTNCKYGEVERGNFELKVYCKNPNAAYQMICKYLNEDVSYEDVKAFGVDLNRVEALWFPKITCKEYLPVY